MTNEFHWPGWMGEEPRKNTPWNEREERVVLTFFRQGLPLGKIAKIHGRAIGGIVQRLRNLLGEEEFEELQRTRLSNRGTYLGQVCHPGELVDAEVLAPDEWLSKYGTRRDGLQPEVRRALTQIQQAFAIIAKHLG